MTKLVKIGSRFVNPLNVTYVIDREIHFNDGSRWVATEPEIQDLLSIMFETPRAVVEEEPLVVKKATVVAKKATKKK